MASIPAPPRWVRRRGLRVAPLRRRLLASLIDGALVLVALAAALAGVGLGVLSKSRATGAGLLDAASSDEPDTVRPPAPQRPDAQRIFARLRSRPVKLGLHSASILLRLFVAERRSPGFRALGLLRADLRDGGPPRRSQRLQRAALSQAWQAVHRALLPRPTAPPPLERQKVREEIEAARRQHAGDQQAQQHAVMRIYRESKVEVAIPSRLLFFARMPLASAIDLPMPWSPLNQSLLDRLTGTVVVDDRRRKTLRRFVNRSRRRRHTTGVF
jgi:hypothetical protein